MAAAIKSSGKGRNKSKEVLQPQRIEPVGEASDVAIKTVSSKKVIRKSARVNGKATVSSQSEEKSLKKERHKKVKMIRDSFNMPEYDYAKIAELKKICLAAGLHVKKSELLRLGLNHLSKLSKDTLLRSVKQLERIKTGRPAKHR